MASEKKIIGYTEMKKQKGKVVYYSDSSKRDWVVGITSDKEFVYGDLSDKITKDSLGKSVTFEYEKGYNDKLRVCGLNIE